tara:strand:- start:375 stop:1139 length:765 start_codon:yes stop_codon:yes gene_type:complete
MSIGIYEGMELVFTHLPTGKTVRFLAYLENLADMYSSNWNAEDVYGRMDPIVNFINTRRSFSVSWNVPANSYDEAMLNLKKVNLLMSFLYPLYAEGSGGATAINQAPLMRVKFGNLIQNISGKGLLGYLNGFTMDPKVENGMFHHKGTNGMEYYPKTILLNTELNVLHEHELGFKKEGNTYKFRGKGVRQDNFPYSSSSKLPGEGSKIDSFDRTVTGGRIGQLETEDQIQNSIINDPEGVSAAEAEAFLGPGED